MLERVQLDANELAHCQDVGRRRQLWSAGVKDAHGFKGNGKAIHEDGAIAEYAVAEWLGEKWVEFAPHYKNLVADVGTWYQVRSTRYREGNLLIHPRDPNDQVFILVRLHRLPAVELVGWIWGRAGKKAKYWEDGRKFPAFQGRACYRIPAADLREMRELAVIFSIKARNYEPDGERDEPEL
jgi:hypothetical protein